MSGRSIASHRLGFLATAVLLGALMASLPLSVDSTLPSMPLAAADLRVSDGAIQFSLSIFMAGIAAGQLFYGPVSDRFGRRPVLLVAFVVFAVSAAGCALSESIESFVALRFVQGLAGCAASVLGRAIVRDLFDREQAAKMLAYVMTMYGLAPIVGPVLGAHLTVGLGWRAVYWFLAIYGLLALAIAWRALGETVPERRLDALRPGPLVRTYARILGSRDFVGYMLMLSACYCGLFAFLAASATSLINHIGVSVESYGYLFAGCMMAYVCGSWLSARLVGRRSIRRMILTGGTTMACAGAVMAGLGLGAVDAAWAIVLPMAAFMFAFSFIVPAGQAAAMSIFPDIAGTASSALGFVQLSFSVLTGLLVGHFADGTQLPMTVAIGVVSLLPIPIYLLVVRPGR
ncbi:MAG: multidrug effflux MFS transporter [Defluviicoccus sp.]|nr:multidrug effflux MFS transporter [Defluviicoccus sp.]